MGKISPLELLDLMKQDILGIWYMNDQWSIKKFGCELVKAKELEEAIRLAYQAKPAKRFHV